LLNYPPLKDFLATQLQGARRYDRIAGLFSSSLLEVAGDALKQFVLTVNLDLYITDSLFVIDNRFCV
jgi:hypothetical protein